MKVSHPWPAVIVALVATNVVTAAVLVLWSESRAADEARWAANRERARDLFGLVGDLATVAEWLERAANATLSARDRGDAVANATGPASALVGHAENLLADYRASNATVQGMWSDVATLGLFRRFFPEIARSFYATGGPNASGSAIIDNVTRISRGLQFLLYPIAPGFNASTPLPAFPVDPMSRLSGAEFAAVVALGRRAACLYAAFAIGGVPQCAPATAP